MPHVRIPAPSRETWLQSTSVNPTKISNFRPPRDQIFFRTNLPLFCQKDQIFSAQLQLKQEIRGREKTDQQNEGGCVVREPGVVAGDPVEGDHAIVGRAEALAAVCDGGEGAKEGGEDGLEVAVGGEEGEGAVGEADAG